MKELSKIDSFGTIEAESDPLLISCFEEHPAFAEALKGPRFLILGRKGSGKTALYRQVLRQQGEGVFTMGHTFDEYPWHHHAAQAVIGVAEQEKYLHSWRYLILMTLSRILLNEDPSIMAEERNLDALARIEAFVTDTYGTRSPEVTQLFNPAHKLRGVKKLGLSVAGFGVDAEVAMEKLPTLYSDVNRVVQEMVVGLLNPNHRYYVCFDQLDISFLPDDQDYKLRLIGLLLAARSLVVAARDAGKFVKVLVFLRSDIYDRSLLFEDKHKLTDTYSLALEWDQANDAVTLKSLMERRFAQLLEIPRDGAWEQVFDETTEMGGHQRKYAHILDRTFKRPRDMIKFCNCVLDSHKARLAATAGLSKFSNEDVNLAHQTYSDALLQELVDEVHKHIPDYPVYLEMVKALQYQVFTGEAFEHAYGQWQSRLKNEISATDVLEQLHEFSIIGHYQVGGGGYGGSGYVFKYEDHRSEFNRAAQQYRVHPGLVHALNLKQGRTESERAAE